MGIPTPLLRDVRSIVASVSYVKCAGASTTARLAIGGQQHNEADPAVLYANPPLQEILCRIWDAKPFRQPFVRCWYAIRDELKGLANGTIWQKVRGPTGAAWAHLNRINIDWSKPFEITVLDHVINFLETPPRQVMKIIMTHAR